MFQPASLAEKAGKARCQKKGRRPMVGPQK